MPRCVHEENVSLAFMPSIVLQMRVLVSGKVSHGSGH